MPHHLAERGMRHFVTRREVVPSHRLPLLVQTTTTVATDPPSLVARSPSSSETAACGQGSSCEKPTSNLTTTVIPVVLGAGLPIICAIVVLFILHRRHVKKLIREDANDKHKSLDFGLDDVSPASGRNGRKGMPQMMEPGHSKGMSLDIVHPYLMPPALHGSQDSLHSLSRSIDDDKYRPATFVPHDGNSIRSIPKTRDDASSFAGSTSRYGPAEEPNSGLLRNAQRMSRSSPPLYRSPPDDLSPQHARSHNDHGPSSGLTLPSSGHDERELAIGSATTDLGQKTEQAVLQESHMDLDSSHSFHFETGFYNDSANTAHVDRPNFPLPDHPLSSHDETEHAQTAPVPAPRISLPTSDIISDYGDPRGSELMLPTGTIHGDQGTRPANANVQAEHSEDSQNLDLAFDNPRDTRRLTLGVRPLPPEDPSDNPEQRANRIRSFYKEYFDESKRETTYYEDYGPEFYDGGYVYDSATGDYFDATPRAPFAEPVGRRAMTPPPRAPPRFQGAARHMATSSTGFAGQGRGPRAFSSASGRLPGSRGPRKPVPPPSPLHILPSPHMLKDDSIMLAAEFAPGKNFRDQREGRPDTPTGGMRPYSPATRAHTPLVSAFDELTVIPSPHALRKSGTYTSLDFALPPRFKNSDGGSDAGSIRSNRTGISNTHMNNIRMGNYRVSRLPADMVGTKDDLMSSLRPNWDLRR